MTTGTFSVNAASTWKVPTTVSVKSAGVWRAASGIFVKNNGAWVQVWPNYSPGTQTFAAPAVQNGGFSPPIYATYSFTVPAQVYSITLSAKGAPGTGDCTSCQGYYIWGGSGASCTNKVVAVQPGEVLSISVGGYGAIMSYRTVQCGGYPGSLFTPPYAGNPTTISGTFGTFVFGGGQPDGGAGGTTTVPGGVNGTVQGASDWPNAASVVKIVW